MAEKSIIIIGAGLAGLSTGCYARMNGYLSHIFEHHSKPGGVAAAWKRKGYLIDGGIHFLMGHKSGQPIYDLYHELGTAQSDCCTDLTGFHFTDESSGVEIDITGDFNRLATDLKDIAPNDAKLIDDLIGSAHAIQGGISSFEASFDKPPELMNYIDYLKMFWCTGKAIGIRRVPKAFTGFYTKSMAEYVQNVESPLLRQILLNAYMPEVPVWFVLMLFALLKDGQMGLLSEGCPGFIQPIEERYKSFGGEVTYKATVADILIENNQAIGVRLADGKEHCADVVVSAADGFSTIYTMLGGRYIDKKIEDRYRSWPLIRPYVMVSFGVEQEFPNQLPISLIMLKDPMAVGHQAIRELILRIFNYGSKFASPGKTVVQATFETDWDFWNDMQRERERYDEEKQRIAEDILVRLEAHYPGISSLVEVTDIATPYTTWRYTRNHKGAYMGWLPTPENIMTFIPRTLPGLANFYMAGQWVMPGGGVPTCLYSGRHVVQILCHRDRKRFVTSACQN